MPSAALERHPASPCAALRGIEASVTRGRDGSLQVAYRLDGDLDRLKIPQARAPRVVTLARRARGPLRVAPADPIEIRSLYQALRAQPGR